MTHFKKENLTHCNSILVFVVGKLRIHYTLYTEILKSRIIFLKKYANPPTGIYSKSRVEREGEG